MKISVIWRWLATAVIGFGCVFLAIEYFLEQIRVISPLERYAHKSISVRTACEDDFQIDVELEIVDQGVFSDFESVGKVLLALRQRSVDRRSFVELTCRRFWIEPGDGSDLIWSGNGSFLGAYAFADLAHAAALDTQTAEDVFHQLSLTNITKEQVQRTTVNRREVFRIPLDVPSGTGAALIGFSFDQLIFYRTYSKGLVSLEFPGHGENANYRLVVRLPIKYELTSAIPVDFRYRPEAKHQLISFPTLSERRAILSVENLNRLTGKDTYLFVGGALLGTGVAILAELLLSILTFGARRS
jgi:hypothetical protein